MFCFHAAYFKLTIICDIRIKDYHIVIEGSSTEPEYTTTINDYSEMSILRNRNFHVSFHNIGQNFVVIGNYGVLKAKQSPCLLNK